MKNKNKTICITYNSFHLLKEYQINMCIFETKSYQSNVDVKEV